MTVFSRELDEQLAAVVAARSRDPFAVLGPHPSESGRGFVIRTLQPAARSVNVRLLPGGERRPMQRRGAHGLFEVTLSSETLPDYRLSVEYSRDHALEHDDPYRYGRVLTDFDLHLFAEGTHNRVFEKLGAHRIRVGSTTGVHFAVWAPNADRVSLVGDFNGWDGRVHPMRLLAPAGVWEVFIPDLPDGEKYKFEIRTRTGAILTKTDPFARAFEAPPQSAAIVHDTSTYRWNDQA